MQLLGVPDHAEEGVTLLDSVDGPRRVEDLVSTVLGVDLGEHEELDVRGVSRRIESEVGLEEVVELRRGEGESEGGVGFEEEIHGRVGDLSFLWEDRDELERSRSRVSEDGLGGRSGEEEGLGHPVVKVTTGGGKEGSLDVERTLGDDGEDDSSLDPGDDSGEVAHPRDIGSLGGPRGEGSKSRDDPDGGGDLGGGGGRSSDLS